MANEPSFFNWMLNGNNKDRKTDVFIVNGTDMLKAVNLLSLYVKDIELTVSFYRQLGFQLLSNEGTTAEVGIGNMRIQFIAQETARDLHESFQRDAFGEPKGTGIYISVEVTDVDKYYDYLQDEGIKTSTKPRNWPWGQREFVVRDPDTFKLVFYQKLDKTNE